MCDAFLYGAKTMIHPLQSEVHKTTPPPLWRSRVTVDGNERHVDLFLLLLSTGSTSWLSLRMETQELHFFPAAQAVLHDTDLYVHSLMLTKSSGLVSVALGLMNSHSILPKNSRLLPVILSLKHSLPIFL